MFLLHRFFKKMSMCLVMIAFYQHSIARTYEETGNEYLSSQESVEKSKNTSKPDENAKETAKVAIQKLGNHEQLRIIFSLLSQLDASSNHTKSDATTPQTLKDLAVLRGQQGSENISLHILQNTTTQSSFCQRTFLN